MLSVINLDIRIANDTRIDPQGVRKRDYADIQDYADIRGYTDIRDYANIRDYTDIRGYTDIRDYSMTLAS